jgi:hypothetical protein
MDLTKIDNLEFDGVDERDAPDYCDAYVSSADIDGRPMTDAELDELNEDHREWVYGKLINL